MRKALCLILTLVMLLPTVACGSQQSGGIDYLVLVNKENKLPDDWEGKLETVTVKNSIGDDVEVEKKAYEAYEKLKAALAAEDVHVDLDSARRSVAEQRRIWDDFMDHYGEVYTKRTVATPGFSEHHTGLALDLYLIIDGQDVVENEEMIRYTEIWAKIHEKLAQYGFILRYLEGKEAVTGYGYEPWHIRYVDSPAIAGEITKKGITLEEYLNKLPVGNVAPPAEEETAAEETEEAVPETEEPQTAAEEAVPEAAGGAIYGQDPLAVIPGNYVSKNDNRMTAAITALETGAVQIIVTGSNGASNYTEWAMTGEIDDALAISYSDGAKKNVTLSENSVIEEENLEYKDGKGTVVFNREALEFTWTDERYEGGPIVFIPAED